MEYNVFDTEQEALKAEKIDYQMHINVAHNNRYISITKKWDEPIQRRDGKWIYRLCLNGVLDHNREEYSSNWF